MALQNSSISRNPANDVPLLTEARWRGQGASPRSIKRGTIALLTLISLFSIVIESTSGGAAREMRVEYGQLANGNRSSGDGYQARSKCSIAPPIASDLDEGCPPKEEHD
jgi:hypothetical protein